MNNLKVIKILNNMIRETKYIKNKKEIINNDLFKR